MWFVLVGALAWAQDEGSPEEAEKPWNNKFSAGLPRASATSSAINIDAATRYQKKKIGFGVHFGTDTKASGDLNTLNSTQSTVFDAQLRYTPERPPEDFALEWRMEMAYEVFSTAYIGTNNFSTEQSSVSSLSVIGGGRLPEGGDWSGSVWGRLIRQSEAYVQIGANNSSFDAQSSLGWAGFGVFERSLGPVSISTATEARQFTIRRLSVFTGGNGSGLDTVRVLELEEQVGVWFSRKVFGLQPGVYAGLEVTRSAGADTVMGYTPAIGASLVGDLIDAPSF